MVSQLLTPANQLTILRMAFIPAFVILVVYNQLGWAFLIFLLAGITDGLDGLIARLLHQKTTLGALLDPIADKLLLTSSFVILSVKDLGLSNILPLWLTITVISRDIFLVTSALIIMLSTGHRNFPPSFYGKASTLIQLVTVTFVLFLNYKSYTTQWLLLLYILTGAITIISGMHYIYRVRKILPRSSTNPK
ncbi:MAG: CDP-alcohol phosphatidyltransferase family protein [Acidobacteriia bacterium]|nr:CDP-alcohol phosphatidyltransferase family protein [Terriglobia bacterium]